MSMKLYVGNISFDTTQQDLEALFSEIGTVTSTNLIEDRETGRPRGFGFVEMGSADQAEAAIRGMNGQNVGGRDMVVNIARPMEPRTGGGGFGGGRREGGGGGFGGGRPRY